MIIKKNKLREAKKISVQTEKSEFLDANTETAFETEVDLPSQKYEKTKDTESDLFDIENIDFNQREERRRGTRRRGYRRIDDRNLVSRAQIEAVSIK